MVICSHSIVILFNSIAKQVNKFIQPFTHTFILSLCLVIIPGCNSDNRVDEDKMVLIYSDLLIAQDTTFVNETDPDSLISAVLKKHNVSEDKYEKTIDYYNQDIKRWEEFFDKVTTHIERSLSQPTPKERAN